MDIGQYNVDFTAEAVRTKDCFMDITWVYKNGLITITYSKQATEAAMQLALRMGCLFMYQEIPISIKTTEIIVIQYPLRAKRDFDIASFKFYPICTNKKDLYYLTM